MRSEEEIRDHLKEVKRYKEVLWKEGFPIMAIALSHEYYALKWVLEEEGD